MGKKIFLTIITLLATVFSMLFSTVILMNNPEPIGLLIVLLLIIFVALVIYVQIIDMIESKPTKKVPLKNKPLKDDH